jgi:hypothetical protein
MKGDGNEKPGYSTYEDLRIQDAGASLMEVLETSTVYCEYRTSVIPQDSGERMHLIMIDVNPLHCWPFQYLTNCGINGKQKYCVQL